MNLVTCTIRDEDDRICVNYKRFSYIQHIILLPSHNAAATIALLLLAIFLLSPNPVARSKSSTYTHYITPSPEHVLAHSAIHELILNHILIAEECLTCGRATDTLRCICKYVTAANGEIFMHILELQMLSIMYATMCL